MSNGLYTDQDWHFVGPDLDPNCLQRSSADNEIKTGMLKVNRIKIGQECST